MKVLHILNSFSLGGAETIALNIIENINSNDIEFAYCGLSGGNISNFLPKTIKQYYLSKLSINKIKKVIKDFKPDIIHAHDFRASLIAALACQIPIISHIHHNAGWISKYNAKTIIYNSLSKKIKKFVFVSQESFDEYVFRDKIANRTLILPNMIDKNKILLLSNKYDVTPHIDLLYVGRLESAKNPLDFLRAVKLISKKININAVMLGQGTLEDQCKNYIKENRLDNVKMEGFISNPYPYINATKILLVPSNYEGFGLVAEEAKILSKIVVARNVGGLKTIVNNDSGFLFENIEDASDEIYNLLTNETYYVQKQKNIKNDKKSYLTNKEFIKEIIKIYSL